MLQINTQVVVQLELDFAGIIWKTWPPLEGELAKVLYGGCSSVCGIVGWRVSYSRQTW